MTLKMSNIERPWSVLRADTGNHPRRPNIGQPNHDGFHGKIQPVELGSTLSQPRTSPRTSPRSCIAGSTTWMPLPAGLPGLQYADRADRLGTFLPLNVESPTSKVNEMLALQQATMSVHFSTEQTEDTAPEPQDVAMSNFEMKDKPKTQSQSPPKSHHQVAEIAKRERKANKIKVARRDAVESASGVSPRGNYEGHRIAPSLDGIRGLSNNTGYGKIENDENTQSHIAEQQPKPSDKKPGNQTRLQRKHTSNTPASPTKEQIESQCLELRIEVLGLRMQLLEKTVMERSGARDDIKHRNNQVHRSQLKATKSRKQPELASHNVVLEAHVSELRKDLQTLDWMIKEKQRKHEMAQDAAEEYQVKLDDVRYGLLRESKRKLAKKAEKGKISKKDQGETITITGKAIALRVFLYAVVFMGTGIITFPIVMLLVLFTK
ncbi:hypothetical protein F4814DRAFT_405010 [Daldinia grandis]|nr:hypothetical protein F4814DRAFT_405010 [Daldinia grandis]